MKTRTAEQLCRKHAELGRKFIAWLKRRTARKWRREAKRHPEEAPVKRPTKGWSD